MKYSYSTLHFVLVANYRKLVKKVLKSGLSPKEVFRALEDLQTAFSEEPKEHDSPTEMPFFTGSELLYCLDGRTLENVLQDWVH